MDFSLSDEHRIFQDMIRGFARRELAPVARQIDHDDAFPRPLFDKLGALGCLGLNIGPPYWDSPGDVLTGCIMAEELARISPGFTGSVMAHVNLGVLPIARFGSDDLKARYLPAAARGEIMAGFAITEPNAGSDVACMQATAVHDGGDYVINGRKIFITNGHQGDIVTVAASVDRSAGFRGIELFVVERGVPGFSSRKVDKMSWRGSDTGELTFEDCRVPAANRIGDEPGGFVRAMQVLHLGRINISSYAVGVAQGAFDLALRYAKDRVQFGKPIGKHQLIRGKIARASAKIEAARCLSYYAAWLEMQGKPSRTAASQAKIFSSEVCQEVAAEAMQIFGGYGMSNEYDIGRFFRDSRVFTVGEGTSEIHVGILAREFGL